MPPGGGYWAIRICGDAVDVVWVPAAQPLISARELAERAAGEVGVAECGIGTAPPADHVVVRFATWLWLEGCAWAPRSRTAAIPGLSATVTVSPVEVHWEMGDGSVMRCAGPGVRWNPEVPAEAQSTDCSYVYRRSSSDQPEQSYLVTATVGWEVSWSASNGEGGTLPAVLASSSSAVRVGEVQTIVEA
ncbi:MAG: hypothetical protein ACRDWD_14095 [Acidimicrobiia bacterium]